MVRPVSHQVVIRETMKAPRPDRKGTVYKASMVAHMATIRCRAGSRKMMPFTEASTGVEKSQRKFRIVVWTFGIHDTGRVRI
jgi:hypothetical protein